MKIDFTFEILGRTYKKYPALRMVMVRSHATFVFSFSLTFFFIFKKLLEDMSPFCGATDIPVLDFLVTSPLGFKARVGNLICASQSTWQRCMWYMFPEIHLWCDTCRPPGGQHGSRGVSSTYLTFNMMQMLPFSPFVFAPPLN